MHVNLQAQARAALVDKLRQRLGLANDSELVRRLIDQEAARLGLAGVGGATAEAA